MACLENFHLQSLRSINCCVKVAEFKPQDDSVPVGLKGGVAKWAMVVLNFPFVQLKHEAVAFVEALVLISTVATGETDQFLIPAAAGLDVSYTN
jgi:hypothetical protein